MGVFAISETIIDFLDHSSTDSLHGLGNSSLVSIKPRIYLFFADLFFNATYVFLGLNIDVIFCLAIKLTFLGTHNLFEVMTLFGIVPLKEKSAH